MMDVITLNVLISTERVLCVLVMTARGLQPKARNDVPVSTESRMSHSQLGRR